MDHSLRRLVDRQAIHDVLLRYCRGIDRLDLDLVRQCYHPGARDHHGAFVGPVEDFLPWVAEQVTRFESTTHFLGNVLVEFDDDNSTVAWSEAYCVAFHRLAGDDQRPPRDSIAGFRYVDRFERRDPAAPPGEGWRIADRRVVVDWNRLDEIDAPGFSPSYLLGRRGGDDPVVDRW
mgnify:FL=1|jgi:hypothetical protein